MSGRRLLVLLLVLAIIGLPAVALRAACAGNSCDRGQRASARVPFCPLPEALKREIVLGFREGRSPDVLAVTDGSIVLGGSDPAIATVAWPFVRAAGTTGVPIVFAGTGVDPTASVPDGTGLDQVAPTIASVIGFRRPFPNVRSGVAVDGVADGQRPRLVLEIALKGVGSSTVQADRAGWSFLRSLLREGAGTLEGTTGSLPLDPAATLTTIGTGGTPAQHGITGTFVRNDAGKVVRAFGPGSPVSVIATLPDDLDEALRQRPKIGLVATDPADRGLIGGNWYPRHDRDPMIVASRTQALRVARRLLGSGFGQDDVPDILGVVLAAGPGTDATLRRIVEAARRAAGGSVLIAVAGTGFDERSGGSQIDAKGLVSQVEEAVPGDRPVVAEAVAGGLFLDQSTLTAEGITGQTVVDALLSAEDRGGEPVMADAFQGFAVSFSRYC